MIAIITIFFLGASSGALNSVMAAAALTMTILIGVFMTFAASYLLSKTVLRGLPSSFALELPPYRKPQVGRVIVRSLMDRTMRVLLRAAAVAAPAGCILFAVANIAPGGVSILTRIAGILDPLAALMGLDGVILMAFLLGLPANEIVLPIILMAYLSKGTIADFDNLSALRTLLIANGWTWRTAVSMLLFSLMHWPCSTTLLTIRKETGSMRWMLLAAILPTAFGVAATMLFTFFTRFLP